MNKMIKTTVIATTLFATAPLFANTTASGQVSGSADISTENQGLLKSLNQGVSNTAHKVGTSIESGIDKTRSATKNTFENSKEVGHAVGSGVHSTADKVGNSIENGVDNTKSFTQEKWQDTKNFTSDKSSTVKNGAQNQWNKTKTVLTPDSKQADAETKSSLELNTPIGGAKANLNTNGSIKTE